LILLGLCKTNLVDFYRWYAILILMDDKDIEKINTVDVRVTAESLDAHVICLRQNGYSVQKAYYRLTQLAIAFLLGAFIVGKFLQWKR